MTATASVSGVVPGLSRVIARFPVCVLASLALCAVLNLDIAGVIRLDDHMKTEVILGLVAVFLAGGIGHLFAEGRGWTGVQNLALALGLAGIAGTGRVLQPAAEIDPLFLLSGLVLLLMVAAYARRSARPDAFWLFNARLSIAVAVATAVGLLLGAGIWAVLETYGYLFPPGPGDRWRDHTWATAITLAGPLCGLALIQGTFDEGTDPVGDRTLFGRIVSILAAWVLVPIAIVAALLLHAYAAKVVWQWQLPDNEIGPIVLTYVAGGTAAWLIVQPWAEHGNRLLRWFAASWLKVAIVPTVLLGAAVARRIWAYGILPERYGLALVALWVFAIAAYAAWIRGRPDPRVAVGVLGLALVASAFGPWGARGLSIRDQAGRLTAILETNGVLKDGRVVLPLPADRGNDHQAQQGVATIVSFLDSVDALDSLAPLFEGLPDNPIAGRGSTPVTRQQVADALDVRGSGRPLPKPRGRLYFRALVPGIYPVGNSATLVGPLDAVGVVSKDQTGAWLDGQGLAVRHDGSEWHVAAKDLIQGLPTPVPANGNQVPVVIELVDDPALKILIESVLAEEGDPPDIKSAKVWLILQKSPK